MRTAKAGAVYRQKKAIEKRLRVEARERKLQEAHERPRPELGFQVAYLDPMPDTTNPQAEA